MEYRMIDEASTEENILRQRAVEADTAAYQKEVEVLRLEALEKIVSGKEDRATLKDLVTKAKLDASVERNRANRLNNDDLAKDEDFSPGRREFLEKWVESLEGEHISHATVAKQRQASLDLEGDLAPAESEKERIKTNIQANLDAMNVIESAWQVATKELDKL